MSALPLHRVVVLDPRRLVREALVEVLGSTGRWSVTGSRGRESATSGAPAHLYVAPEPVPGLETVSLEAHDVADRDALVATVDAALAGDRSGASTAAPTSPALELSPHERAVLTCISTGLTAAGTAEQLGVSRKSVENAKRRLFHKLGARSQAEAVALDRGSRRSGSRG